MAGTASTVPAILLLEYPGPWGVVALRDARFADGLGGALAAHAREAGVRVLLIRRPGRPNALPDGHRIFAMQARPPYTWTETATLADPRDVLDLDLGRLREGRSLGLERHEEPVFAICTHGRHDACCAERGRPVAAALAEHYPEETWEVSHLGGDRFAANMLVAPSGLYYGRLDPESALAVAAAAMRDEVELDHLRGRTGYPMPVQAADIALRRHLGVTAPVGPRLVAREVDGETTTATFHHDGTDYAVTVRSTAAEATLLTCRAVRPQAALRHEVLGVEPLLP